MSDVQNPNPDFSGSGAVEYRQAAGKSHGALGQLLARHEAKLLAIQAVTSVGIGLGPAGGEALVAPCVRLVVAPPITRMIRAGATRHAKKSPFTRVHRTGPEQGQGERNAHLGSGGSRAEHVLGNTQGLAQEFRASRGRVAACGNSARRRSCCPLDPCAASVGAE